METDRLGSDGRRIFTADLKREQIERVVKGSVTLSELSRELSVSASVVRRWKHLSESGSGSAMQANEEVVPARELRTANERIGKLEHALGKKAMEVEILQAARNELERQSPPSGHWVNSTKLRGTRPISTQLQRTQRVQLAALTSARPMVRATP